MSEWEMGWSGWVAVGAMSTAGVFLIRYVGVNFSLTATMLGLLLLFHGPAYIYYTRVWGPATSFYNHILAAAPGQPVIRSMDLAIVSLFLFLLLGIRFADVCWRENSRSMRRAIVAWGSGTTGASVTETARLRFWLVVVALGVLVPFFFLEHQWSKVLQYLSTDLSGQDKSNLRREEAGSGFYLYNLLIATFAPFLAFCTVAARTLSSRQWVVPSFVFVGLVAVAKMALLSKAPVAVFVLQLVVTIMMCKSLQIHARVFYRVTVIATALFAVMSMIAIPTLDGVGLVGNFLFYRVFMIANESLLEYFSAIPYVLPFSWGAKISWVAGLLHGNADLPNYWLVARVHRGMLGSTTAALFLGDAWADWAWAGVIVFPFVIGFFLRALDIRLIGRRGKSIATIGALGLGHYGIFVALHTSLQTSLLTGGLLLALLFCHLIGGSAYRRGGALGTPAPSRL